MGGAMRLAVVIPTWHPDRAERMVSIMRKHEVTEVAHCIATPGISQGKLGVVESMLHGAKEVQENYEVILFLHDDVEIYEDGWDERLLNLFWSVERCGLAGFGGAFGLGTDDMYKHPYRLQSLIRYTFLSNMKDWRVHGYHTTTTQQAATLDGFSLAVRTQAYKDIGTWQAAIDHHMPEHHMYDAWIACMMRRHGWETWLVPVHCHHHGGLTATTDEYQEFCKAKGWKDGDELFEHAHRVIYEEFRDVLPMRVP